MLLTSELWDVQKVVLEWIHPYGCLFGLASPETIFFFHVNHLSPHYYCSQPLGLNLDKGRSWISILWFFPSTQFLRRFSGIYCIHVFHFLQRDHGIKIQDKSEVSETSMIWLRLSNCTIKSQNFSREPVCHIYMWVCICIPFIWPGRSTSEKQPS